MVEEEDSMAAEEAEVVVIKINTRIKMTKLNTTKTTATTIRAYGEKRTEV